MATASVLAADLLPDVTSRSETRRRTVNGPHSGRPGAVVRDDSVEALRGLAVLLMVLGHVIGDSESRGLQVGDDSWCRYLYYSTSYLRMPLFTVISGFVYALRPLQPGSMRRFVRGKARRLLVPLLTVASLQFAIQGLVPGSHRTEASSELWRVFAYGYDQFWFLQALFCVFLTVGVLEQTGGLSSARRWMGALTIAVLGSHFLPKVDLFSLWGYLFLLPYFLLGCGMGRFPALISRRPVRGAAIVLFAGGLCVHQRAWFGRVPFPFDPTGWLALSIGVGGAILLFWFRRPQAGLSFLGRYSFSIFLFHVFATAGSRIGLSRIGMTSFPVQLVAGLVLGVAAPVVAEHVIRRSRPLRTVLLGMS